MTTRVKLKPGQKGTKKLLTQYGDALVCARYRYDKITNRQFKTVESKSLGCGRCQGSCRLCPEC